MKTSILYGSAERPWRASLPGEVVPGNERKHIRPVYIESHAVSGPVSYIAPDAIFVGNFSFGVNWLRGGEVKPTKRDGAKVGAWIISPAVVDELDRLDSEIKALQDKRAAVAKEALASARLLRVNDIERSRDE